MLTWIFCIDRSTYAYLLNGKHEATYEPYYGRSTARGLDILIPLTSIVRFGSKSHNGLRKKSIKIL